MSAETLLEVLGTTLNGLAFVCISSFVFCLNGLTTDFLAANLCAANFSIILLALLALCVCDAGLDCSAGAWF